MKCNPIRWLWGLVPLLGLGGLMHLSGTFTGVETDLKQRAEKERARSVPMFSIDWLKRSARTSAFSRREFAPRRPCSGLMKYRGRGFERRRVIGAQQLQ